MQPDLDHAAQIAAQLAIPLQPSRGAGPSTPAPVRVAPKPAIPPPASTPASSAPTSSAVPAAAPPPAARDVRQQVKLVVPDNAGR
jgi:hypothetical protein